MQWAITYPQAVCVNCNEQITCMRSLTDQECIMSVDEGDGTGWYPCAEAGDRHYVDGGLVYPCSQCRDGYYQSRDCTNTTNRVCTQCTDPCGDNYYQSQDCTNTTNRVCTQCTSNCPAGQYKTRDCTDTQDITCEECPIIRNSSDGVTVICDDGDGGNSRIEDGSGNRCIHNYYYNTVNNTCVQCSPCSSGQYISQECGENSDTVCAQCTPIENSSPGVTVTCTGDSNSEIADGSGNRCIQGYYYNDSASAHVCEPDYKTCLQLKTDNSPTLACPEGVGKVSNHDTKIVHGVPSSVGGIQSDETNYHQFCCESTKYTCAELHSDNESVRPPDDNKLECTSGEFDIANSPLVSIVYDNVISHDDQRKQDLFDIACCREADLHFSDRNECVCGENGDTPNNVACISVNPLNLLAGGEPTLTPGLEWVTKNGTLSREWSQADILCDQGLINSYCARNVDNECNNRIPDAAVHASP